MKRSSGRFPNPPPDRLRKDSNRVSKLPSRNRRGARRAGWSGTNHVDSESTTPALRATPPISGGEFLPPDFPSKSYSLILCLLLFCSSPARAQDTRTVTEPKTPEVCATLDARLTSDLDETKPDTNRIQDALDHCAAGHAVKLTRSGRNDAFLSGPLQLKSAVTLLVDANTTLFGSRDPRDYDVSRGSCGVVNKSGRGCKPLIGGDHLEGADVIS